MQKTNNDQILAYVAEIKRNAESEQAAFKQKKRNIEEQANRPIDLFGGSAISNVAAIAKDTRIACDDLYAALQLYVRILDEKCRALMDDTIDFSTIKAVSALISELNESSAISVGFTASLNYESSNDVANVEYLPTIQSKMIEKYWENLYESHPERQKEKQEKSKKEKKAAEEQRTQEKKEEERYKRECERWEEQKAIIKSKREEELKKRVCEFKENTLVTAEQKYSTIKAKLDVEIARLDEQICQEVEYYDTLGVFAFFKKHNSTNRLSSLREEKSSKAQELILAEEEYKETKNNIKSIVKKQEKIIKSDVRTDFPIPIKPKVPLGSRLKAVSQYQVRYVGVAIAIYDFMYDEAKKRRKSKNTRYTVETLKDKCPACSVLGSGSTITSLNLLISENLVRSFKRDSNTYYELIEDED